MKTSNEIKTTGSLVAIIDREKFETDDVYIDVWDTVIAGGQRKGSGKSTYVELPKSITQGVYNIGGGIKAWYNHGHHMRSWFAESGTITIDFIEMQHQHYIRYKFDFVAVEPEGEGRRFRLSGGADLRGLWNENKKHMRLI